MKLNGTIILVLAIFAAVVIVAGCTSSSPSPTATTAPAGGATVTVGATSAPSGGGVTLGSMMDMSKVKWYEYQMGSNEAGTSTTSKIRQDFGVDYNGTKANEVTMNMNMGSGDSATNMVISQYTDASTGATLGGHEKMTSGGQVVLDQDIPAGAKPSTTPGTTPENPILTLGNMGMTKSGTESVTVPAGTFTADKYTYTDNGATGTVWVSRDVPVPLKFVTTSSGSTTIDMELTGWG